MPERSSSGKGSLRGLLIASSSCDISGRQKDREGEAEGNVSSYRGTNPIKTVSPT